MALTEYYVNDAGSGTGSGTSEANAMSFATFTDYMSTGGSFTAAAGDRFNIKGAITSRTTTTDTWVNGGTATSPVIVRGYGTAIGDGYQGRTNGNGDLNVTNMPTLTYTTGRLNVTGTFIIIESLNISTANSAAAVTLAASCAIVTCKVTNSSTNGAANGISLGTNGQSIILNCDAILSETGGGATAGVAVITAQGASQKVIGNRIKSVSSGGVVARATSVIAFNTIFTNGSIGIFVDVNSATNTIMCNTIVAGGGDGIKIVTGTTTLQFLFGNMITDNAGDGIDMTQTSIAGFLAFNRFRDNASSIANGGDWITATSYGNVDSGTTGTTATDYENYAGNDYRLVATSPATSAGLPAYASIGALQRSQTGGGGATSFTF